MKKWLSILTATWMVFSCSSVLPSVPAEVEISESSLIQVGTQPLFLSGMNLAWMEFAQDLSMFNDTRWQNSIQELSYAGANTVRWWIHVNGSDSPEWNGDQISGIEEEDLVNFKRALDVAWQKGILVIPCLWSFDMLQPQNGVDQERNKRLLEDDQLLQTYIDNALIPMIEYLGHHPAIAAWEVFNEPEGMTEFGWTPIRTNMKTVQKVVNRIAGAIHRTDPEALVSNGSWSFKVLTDVGGMTNYYSDEALISAGGDSEGILDFYMVHFYPQHFSEAMSPFHHPATYWELDKPIVIGEFPALGINGQDLAVKTTLSSQEAYLYAIENGYAGCLAWTMTNHDGFGGLSDASPGILAVRSNYPEYIKIDQSQMDKIPDVIKPIETMILRAGSSIDSSSIDLTEIFNDKEDGSNLVFTAESSQKDIVDAQVEENRLFLNQGTTTGVTTISLGAKDTFGNTQKLNFLVYSLDPDRGNIALLKEVKASSIDMESNLPNLVVDGLFTTRWSSDYANGESLTIDLGKNFLVNSLKLYWEVAYGKEYQILGSMDGESWTVLAEITDGDGEIDEIVLQEPMETAYIQILGIERATEWGFSLWECEVYGTSL